MNLWVIIPVKPLQRAKSRLASTLSPNHRRHLAEVMFRHVLTVVRDLPGTVGTLVISRDPKALAIARDYSAKTVQESGSSELNAALMRATQVVRSWNASAVLILPADLPLVTSEDLQGMIALGDEIDSVIIAPDHEEDGTNAMLVRPPGLIDYTYGVGSYQLHTQAAQAVGATVKRYDSVRLALDIDVPQDLEAYNAYAQANGFPVLPMMLTGEAN